MSSFFVAFRNFFFSTRIRRPPTLTLFPYTTLFRSQTAVDENIAYPILIGRTNVIDMRIRRYGLRLQPGINVEIVDPEDDYRFNETRQGYFKLKISQVINLELTKALVRKHNTINGSM